MNKYQEAQEYMDMIWNSKGWSRVEINWLAIEQIIELIDKETPKKPIIKRNTHGHIMWGTCDICKSEEPIWFGGRCSNNDCGQRIDWSDEE